MLVLLHLFVLTLVSLWICAPPRIREEAIGFDRVGTVTVYYETSHPSQVMLFLSREHGWDQEAATTARALTAFNAVVVGIDLPHYLMRLSDVADACSYPGGDFDALSKFVQQKFAFPTYVRPILVGVAAGATLAYATLAQAPPDMFQGAISLGFCPELVVRKPLCAWNNLHWQAQPGGDHFTLIPGTALSAPWMVLHGDRDPLCTAKKVESFTTGMPHSEFLAVPEVSHDFSAPQTWMPQFRQAFAHLLATAPAAPQSGPLADLPLVEVPASGAATTTLTVILSGDGGWASIDRQLAHTLASQGVAVIGLNSLHYFWTPRTPEEAARDLERILQHYLTAWQKTDALLIGYSQGADVLPFLANRLSPNVLTRVRGIALLGPAPTAKFEFHFTAWLDDDEDSGRPVLPELEQLQGKRTVCVYGEEETNSVCTKVDPTRADVVRLGGGHHFDGSYDLLARIILRESGVSAEAPHSE